MIKLLSDHVCSIGLGQDQGLKVIKVNRCRLKLVHMGRAVEIDLFYEKETILSAKQSTEWSYLNLYNNSEVIVLVSLL